MPKKIVTKKGKVTKEIGPGFTKFTKKPKLGTPKKKKLAGASKPATLPST